jgi:hypothetical protein
MGTPKRRKVVDADEFILRDRHGKMRARLGMGEDEPRLEFFDWEGKKRVGVGIDIDGAGIDIFDKTGKARAWLGMDVRDPQLILFDDSQRPRALIELTALGSRVALLEPHKEVQAGVPTDEDGNPLTLDVEVIAQLELQVDELSTAILLHNSTGRGRVKLVAGDGGSSIALEDSKGKSSIHLIANSDAPCATFNDKQERQRLGMGLKAGKPSIDLFDAHGKVTNNLE